jgi:hypothetical protein
MAARNPHHPRGEWKLKDPDAFLRTDNNVGSDNDAEWAAIRAYLASNVNGLFGMGNGAFLARREHDVSNRLLLVIQLVYIFSFRHRGDDVNINIFTTNAHGRANGTRVLMAIVRRVLYDPEVDMLSIYRAGQSPPLSRDDIRSIVGKIPRQLAQRTVTFLGAGGFMIDHPFSEDEQRDILTNCHANVQLRVWVVDFLPALVGALSGQRAPPNLMLVLGLHYGRPQARSVAQPEVNVLRALASSSAVRQLAFEWWCPWELDDVPTLLELLRFLPPRLSVLHLPPVDRPPTPHEWLRIWRPLGEHLTLTKVVLPAQPSEDRLRPENRLGNGRFPSQEAMLMRSLVMLECVVESQTLFEMEHYLHPVSGPWGLNEAIFEGAVVPVLAANRERTARSLLLRSLWNPRFLHDQALVAERAYRALRETVPGWIPRARRLLLEPEPESAPSEPVESPPADCVAEVQRRFLLRRRHIRRCLIRWVERLEWRFLHLELPDDVGDGSISGAGDHRAAGQADATEMENGPRELTGESEGEGSTGVGADADADAGGRDNGA